MFKKIVFYPLFFIWPLFTFSQTGSIQGRVIDHKTKETLVGVTVWIEGTSYGASTGIDGEFVINNVKPGVYSLTASIISYRKEVFENIRVHGNKVTRIDMELEEAVTTMKEVEIVDKKTTSTEISVLSAIKNSNLVANGVSSQLITRSQDRDASEVIRRIPGITLFNGRFVVVRGLNQRYNTVFLNNASTPSSEADSRAFSFDILPSSVLENIMVYKTPSAELPADFSGAFIDVQTKDTPTKNTFEISYTASFREQSTFNDFYTYKGGSLDFLGIDDGTRELPSGFPSTDQFKKISEGYTPADRNTLNQLGQEINKNWTYNVNQALFDNRLNLVYAGQFRMGRVQTGTINAINYTNTFITLPIHREDYQVYNFAEDKPSPNFDFNDLQSTNTVKTSLLSNWTFVINSRNKFRFNNLFNQNGVKQTTLRQGFEYYSSQQIRAYEYDFMSRTTYSGQLGGDHTFGKLDSRISWTVGYSYSDRNEPDQKRLTTILNTTPSDPYYNRYGLNFGNTASPKYAGIIDQKLREHLVMVRADYTQPFIFGQFKPELRAGLYGEYKYRTFDARLLGYIKSNESLFNQALPYQPFDSVFMDSNINSTDGIKLSESTNPSDSYNANNLQLAGYFTLKLPVVKWLTLYAGLRVEQNRQELNSFSSDLSTLPVHYNNNALNFFPSVNVTFKLSQKSLIRLAYGSTINRPEFREIAPFNFYIFQENASFVGNPQLKNAFIQNVDLRYEYYPAASEMVSAGIFFKHFIHPIEITYINSGSGLAYGPVNAASAYSYGAEIELRQSLGFLAGDGWARGLKNFSWVLNASYIRSSVTFPDSVPARDRYMQGQSPFIINAGLYYQSAQGGWASSLLYNVMGKRIIMVGQANQDPTEDIPDIYEMPFHSLDFTISKKFGKHFQIKGGVQNILNSRVLYQQTVVFNQNGTEENRDQPTLSYNAGRYYSLGVTVIL